MHNNLHHEYINYALYASGYVLPNIGHETVLMTVNINWGKKASLLKTSYYIKGHTFSRQC